MLGNPMFKKGDKVHFNIETIEGSVTKHGEVFIVDAFGTFEQNKFPSYDIMVREPAGYDCLYKHIAEPRVKADGYEEAVSKLP